MLVARRSGSEELLQRLERVRLVLERYVKRATLLLDVSRINADNIDLRFEELDIAEILGETVDTYAVEARKPFPMPALLETVGALLERAPGSSRPTPPRSSSPR
jgi:K+-sensing histidine kinase KdpD